MECKKAEPMLQGTPNFFGLTRLGPPHPFACSSKKHCERCDQKPRRSISQIPIYAFVDAFQRREEVENPSHQVRRVHVPEVIEDALGRKLDDRESELLVRSLRRHFRLELGNISLPEFEYCLKRFHQAQAEVDSTNQKKCKGICGGACDIRKKNSNAEIKAMKVRHKREKHGPADVFQYPITDNQQYGWDIENRTQPKDEYYPRKARDVTKSEGICLDNYYPTF